MLCVVTRILNACMSHKTYCTLEAHSTLHSHRDAFLEIYCCTRFYARTLTRYHHHIVLVILVEGTIHFLPRVGTLRVHSNMLSVKVENIPYVHDVNEKPIISTQAIQLLTSRQRRILR